MNTPITQELLGQWQEEFRSSPERRVATLALSRTDLNDVAFDPAAANRLRHKFTIEIDTMKATTQQASGRCWLFAALNVLREQLGKAKNIEQFEFSQSYLAFWDKFERANYFLESILSTADLPTDDRVVQHILTTGVHDGGQWDMFVQIVEKYGLVPKDVYDEPYQVCHTRSMNAQLNRYLKACAVKLRALVKRGAAAEEVTAEKNAMLGKVYGFLCSCYGEPPKAFDFEYVDKDDVYHVERGLTPMQFYRDNIGDTLARTVGIIHAPTADKPFHRTFTVKLLGNVVGGKGVKYLNLPMEEFKAAIIAQLKAGKVVWFGSDVGKFGQREIGIWDDRSFDFAAMTGLDLELDKAESLDYWYAAMNHAMVLTGVNLDAEGKPTRWRIENSWGDKNGDKGYYVCSDSWFDRYVFQAAVEREYLGEAAALTAQEPIELAPWDPMGTLAD